eukprot:TRINITY_DN5935_c0_g3_i2.p2 TRINITY_DN5935_c0_g3~~TRINITY_DN5935_c0_g3_i2.p2  ORF type:complete len:260 (-),score=58.81 TRINITY_DN5935_c0_g3_i2:46-825(-)
MRYHFHFLQAPGHPRPLPGAEQVPQLGSDGAGRGATSATGGRARSPKGGARGGGGGGGGAAAAIAAASAAGPPKLPAQGGEGELDALLSGEGLDLAFPERGRRTTRRRKEAKKVEEEVDDNDVRSLRRLRTNALFLLVRYAGGQHWTFPKADRAHGDAMRETLFKLCGRQLSPTLQPYIIGACPFSHWKLRSDLHPGIRGRKVFYYRGRLVPGSEVAPPDDSPIADWAWCSRAELPKYLGAGEWQAVRDGLPLENLAAE